MAFPGPSESPPRHFPGPLASLLITFAALFSTMAVALLFGEKPDLGALGVGQVVGFGLVAILATQRIPPPHAERIGLRGLARRHVPLIVLLLPVVFLTSEIDNVIRDLVPIPPDLDPEALKEQLDTTTTLVQIQLLIVGIGLAPVMEEWLFRGVILQGLVGTNGRVAAISISAMLFALIHIPASPLPSAIVSALVVSLLYGVLLGVVRIATGSLLAAILLHAGINLLGVGAQVLSDVLPIQGFNVPDSHTPLTLLLPALVAVGIGFTQLARAYAQAPLPLPLELEDPRSRD